MAYAAMFGVPVLLGVGLLSYIEKSQPRITQPRGMEAAVASQNRALLHMLEGLPDKSLRQKLEDAAAAQANFMAPQPSSVVSLAQEPSHGGATPPPPHRQGRKDSDANTL